MTQTSTDTMYVRTTDTAWVAKYGGTYGRDHVAAIPVAGPVERFTFCGVEHVRHEFPTAPKDGMGQRVLVLPVPLIARHMN